MKKKYVFPFFAGVALIVGAMSCTKEVAPLAGPNDAQLFAMTQDLASRFFYQGDSATIIPPAPQQGNFHGPFKLWFNATVKNQLGTDGKVGANTILQDSALLVKVSYSGNTIAGYSVMFKLNQGWSWAQFSPTGQVWHSIADDKSLCLSCHAGTGNRDFTLVSVYH